MSERLERLSTGIDALDDLLGGGLLPGTLTVVLGATGIGKTQLGLSFAHAGTKQEGRPGIIFDMTARGDSQAHAEYARRLFGWELREAPAEESWSAESVWDADRARCDLMHVFRHAGRRVTRNDMEPEQWTAWKYDLMRRLDRTIGFFYGNFVHGVRRCVVDGIEPTPRAADSFQLETFEYIYHQILRKEADWVARDLFRASFRANQARVDEHLYDHQRIGCMLLLTSREVLLDDLISRPIESGDTLSNANTILLMGKIRDGTQMRRALYVAKHRGSACEETIVPFAITAEGLQLHTA